MSSSTSPCAACKFLRRKCTQECVYASYFPTDQPQRFASVHRVFGAKNVAKILSELDKSHREDAVNSLVYEAEARLHDPVYGCVGLISHLQHTLRQLQISLDLGKKELASMVGPSAMMQMLQNPNYLHPTMAVSPNMDQMMGMIPTGPGLGPLVIRDPQHQQPQPQHQHAHPQAAQEQRHGIYGEEQQLPAMMQVREEQEMMRNFDQQHHTGYFHPQLQLQLQYEMGGGGGGDGGEFCQVQLATTSANTTIGLGGCPEN